MATIKPFKALRARADIDSKVACVPYDVINSEEAAQLAHGNPFSLLHVTRSEIDLPGITDLYSDTVYQKAQENFAAFIRDGILVQDAAPRLYVYSLTMGCRTQNGIVALTSVDEYDNDTIKKHEKTRKDKEDDRTRHLMTLSAHVEPVFLCYRHQDSIDTVVNRIKATEPLNRYRAVDGIEHALWSVEEASDLAALQKAFEVVPFLYVADGHHRSASASRARASLKAANPTHTGNEPYNFFLSVIFPDRELAILPYNRLVKDLNGHSVGDFLKMISGRFEVTPHASPVPDRSTRISMYLNRVWYFLDPKTGSFDLADPIKSLDVSILQDNLLSPVLGIQDPRTDKRIDFCGGIRGTGELEKLVETGKAAVAFSMAPTTVQQLMTIADAGMIMPPKSTWFEPKLRSGLFIHAF